MPVAGCEEFVVCIPCGKNSKSNPAMPSVMKLCGAIQIYRIGGAQAIAGMALDSASNKWVQKIFGPANSYDFGAKRLLCGQVAID